MAYTRDIFICHASEDKKAVARPLADALNFLGLRVWFDEYEIRAGDSLLEVINRGLREARMGAVILSPSFFRKGWAQDELGALVDRQTQERRVVILPIWHEASKSRIAKYSPILAARKAVSTRSGLDAVIDGIAAVVAGDRTGHGDVPQRRHVLEFFNPRNGFPTKLVYNREYITPTPKAQQSTTDEWLFDVRQTFTTLKRIGAANNAELRPTNYQPSTLPQLLSQQINLVTYASSKINPCTEAVLERLSRRFGLDLRFVYQQDAAAGMNRSVFTPNRKKERVALWFQGKVLTYDENASKTKGQDFGVLVRARPSRRDKRLWVIFAGCGRNASVASRLLVFDAKRGNVLWQRLRRAGPLGYFAAVFETRYSPRNNTNPKVIRIVDIIDLD